MHHKASAASFCLVDAMNYVCHNRRGHKLRHDVGTCLRHVSLQRITQHAKGMSLRYGVIVSGDLIQHPSKKSFYLQGRFAVKRRAVFRAQQKPRLQFATSRGFVFSFEDYLASSLEVKTVFFLCGVAEIEFAIFKLLSCDESWLWKFFVVARNLDLLAVFRNFFQVVAH